MPTPPKSVPLPVSTHDPEIDPSVWYAKGLRFSCTQCGNCCTGAPGYVWVTVDDMQRMAEFKKMPLDDFTRAYVRQVHGKYSLRELANYDCVFLTRDAQGKAGCSAYTSRPMQCRTWPFWTENLKSENAWDRASRNCPGIQAGTRGDGHHYDLPHIEKCRQDPGSP